MSLVKDLIRERTDEIGTKAARKAAKIFKQHRECLEELIPEDPDAKWPSLNSMICHIIDHQYASPPPLAEINYWYQHTFDITPKRATKLHNNYWDLQSCLFELSRTDISDKKKVKYFTQVPKLYNSIMAIMSKMAKFEKAKKPEEHYEIT